ncbi:hypothetical protein LDENG_00272200 [Lucifuga dentata]|nr:hypothetical protein LDENG_00272200 [Lucifuga dentata]
MTGSTGDQNSDASGSCKTGLLLSSLKNQVLILADGHNSSTSEWSNIDQNVISVQTNGIHNVIISDPDKIEQNISNNAKASIFSEAEQVLQSSEQKTDLQNDLSSDAGKSGLLSGQSDLNVKAKSHDLSASLPLPSASSVPLGQSEQAAADQMLSLPSHLRESIQKKDQTLSRLLPLVPAQALLSQLLVYNEAQRQKMFATTMFDCGVCFMSWLGSECVQLWECGHVYCRSCLAQFCKVQIAEGNVRGVTCPQPGCNATPTPAQVKLLIGEELFSRYDRLLLQSSLDSMADVAYCPRRSCGSAVILEKGSRAAMCSVCSYAFCVSCRKNYHGIDNCQAKKNMKKQEEEEDTQHPFANLPQTQGRKKGISTPFRGW